MNKPEPWYFWVLFGLILGIVGLQLWDQKPKVTSAMAIGSPRIEVMSDSLYKDQVIHFMILRDLKTDNEYLCVINGPGIAIYPLRVGGTYNKSRSELNQPMQNYTDMEGRRYDLREIDLSNLSDKDLVRMAAGQPLKDWLEAKK